MSTPTLLEYEEKLSERLPMSVWDALLSAIDNRPTVVRVSPSYRWRLIAADPDDDKFVDCAVAGDADYLVTDDRHYRRLKDTEFPKLRVVAGLQFLDVLAARSAAD